MKTEHDPDGTFAACESLLSEDEGAVPTHALRVVFFLDQDGDEMYHFAHEGQATLSTWLGSLELLKEDLITELRGTRNEED